jgi:predicted nucleic acid-binding protein
LPLVDTNVLLDIVTDDPVWADGRSASWMRVPSRAISSSTTSSTRNCRFARIEDLDGVLDEAGVMLAPIPRPALFLAAKVFQQYRAAGGTRNGVLPDFFIGAHAAI